MKLKTVIIFILIGAAAWVIYLWYISPLSTEIKSVYWESPTGGVTFTGCEVNTYRDGKIIAEVPESTTATGTFNQMTWNESGKKWDPIYK